MKLKEIVAEDKINLIGLQQNGARHFTNTVKWPISINYSLLRINICFISLRFLRLFLPVTIAQ